AIDEARQHYLTSLRLCREVVDKVGIIKNLAGLGAVAAQQGDLQLAARFSTAAAALRHRLGVQLPAISRGLLEEALTSVHQALDPSVLMLAVEPLALLEDLLGEVIDGREPVRIEL
ncbi:MAG TPA: hypothetical protein VGD58_21230, partial [Herpetosiphonaceae bacterium]